MTTANASAAAITAMPRHHHGEGDRPRRWAVLLAVTSLLGLAILVLIGAEFGVDAHATARAAQQGAIEFLSGSDRTLAGIRWVR